VRLLLDTHALLWWVIGDPRLSPKAQSLLSSRKHEVLVSAVSSWEVTTKVRLGKLPGAEAFAAEFMARIELLGFGQMPVSVLHGQRAGLLAGTHKDPFDRMLVAQAMCEGIPLVSNEEIFDQYPISRIW
jgi:PIN domain nuclease of toxin-antitoxin system